MTKIASKTIQEINNKIEGDSIYKIHYINLITKISSVIYTLTGYSEVHHIIPRSLNGDNYFSNLIRVNYRDHYYLHKLLMLHYREVNKTKELMKMSMAFKLMSETSLGKLLTNGNDYYLVKKLVKDTQVSIYGSIMGQCHTDEAKSKSLETRIKLYGEPFVNCSSKEVRKKVHDREVELYGSIMGQCHTDEARKKSLEVRKSLFGNACGQMHSREVRNKSEYTKSILYGNKCGMMHTPEAKDKGRDTVRNRLIHSNEFLGKKIKLINPRKEVELEGFAYDVCKYIGIKWQKLLPKMDNTESQWVRGKWKNYLVFYIKE